MMERTERRALHVSELSREKLEKLAEARMAPEHDHLNALMDEEPVFDAKDRFVLWDGRVIYTGPCPFDAPDHATINGRVVVVEGRRYRVTGHQTHATVRGPGRGDEVALVLEPMEED